MRIISGSLGGRILHPPKGLPVRPTTDFAKTALFNLLNSRINLEECDVLDLCCGTGSISFECASRGARKIQSVDAHAACVKYVNETASLLGISNIQALKSDIFSFLEKEKALFQFIFADPPYEAAWIEDINPAILRQNKLSVGGILIIEHGSKTDLADQFGFLEKRKYGNVNFSIFKHHA